jgi:hypothetical protein
MVGQMGQNGPKSKKNQNKKKTKLKIKKYRQGHPPKSVDTHGSKKMISCLACDSALLPRSLEFDSHNVSTKRTPEATFQSILKTYE